MSPTDALLLGQNADGGWGACPGRTSSTEATSFAALALALSALARESRARAVGWLTAHQNADGSWPVSAGVPGGAWVTSLAVLALSVLDGDSEHAARGAAWLIRQEPRSSSWLSALRYRLAPQSAIVRQDPDLKGWPWTPSAAGFVEPTAYALLALKKVLARRAEVGAERRVREGEQMIYDRMCDGGGWNYGNSRVYDVPLSPFPDVTALALVALQDHRSSAANEQSLRTLRDMLGTVRSGLALGWATLCFSLYGEATGEWRRRLREIYARTAFFRATKPLALAIVALGEGAALFRV